MAEVKFLVQAAARLRERGEPFLVATVVRVRGSSYRRPGARMLITRDRWIEGSVSGGCLEKDVLKKAWWRTESGPAVVTYDMRTDTDADEIRSGFGLGCEGAVDVLFERAPLADAPGRADPLTLFAQAVATQRRGAIATVFESATPAIPVGTRAWALGDAAGDRGCDPIQARLGERLLNACAGVLASGRRSEVTAMLASSAEVTALVEPVIPPPRLFLFGSGHDAVPVVRIAQTIGWEVLVCEPGARFATLDRFVFADAVLTESADAILARVDGADRAVALVMGHDYAHDRAWLSALLSSRAAYIGMLGPRARTERMQRDLGLPALDERVFAPLGLALGAESPHEIALAAIAEVQSVLAGAKATSLRENTGPVHVASAAE